MFTNSTAVPENRHLASHVWGRGKEQLFMGTLGQLLTLGLL